MFRIVGEKRRASVSGYEIEYREPSVADLCTFLLDRSLGKPWGEGAVPFVAKHLISVNGQPLPENEGERIEKMAGFRNAEAFIMFFDEIFSGGEKLKN